MTKKKKKKNLYFLIAKMVVDYEATTVTSIAVFQRLSDAIKMIFQ